MTLDVGCDIDSFVLDFSKIALTSLDDLIVKDTLDKSELTFELTGFKNEVIGC
jgi:hypothetical protein